MPAILLKHIPLLLLFTISFSSKFYPQEIKKPFLENEIVPFIPQPTSIKLNDFFIYPSNDKFKKNILPFLSSEILLKIYFYFRNFYPNVNIENFLPDSRFRAETIVLDFQNSRYSAYIFKNELSFFNPIIFENDQNYRTVTLGCNTEEDSIYVLFPSNKIFSFQSYGVTQALYVAFDDNFVDIPFQGRFSNNGNFCAAEEKLEREFAIFAHGMIPNGLWEGELYDYLECITEANKLNCFKKRVYYKTFDLYNKYVHYIRKTRWNVFVKNFCNAASVYPWFPWKCVLPKILYMIFGFFVFIVGSFPAYHVEMLPFYILSFPFGFFLLQYNFVSFYIIPCSFRLISYFLYYKLQFAPRTLKMFKEIQIKPQEIEWLVPYVIAKRNFSLFSNTSRRKCLFLFILNCLIIFMFGFDFTFPLILFQEIHGKDNE